MSRLGRDHLRVGLFLEQLREMGVRLIAVAESIDTDLGEDDFMPFRNIIAEWHARDTSRKIRAIFGARTAQGKHVSGAIIYGYLHDPTDRQKWILDKDAAPIVQRIYRSIIEGKSVTQIAAELSDEKVLTPSAHWTKIGAGMPGKPNANPTSWGVATVINICQKEEYKGWKILNKTIKENYKAKLLAGYDTEQSELDSVIESLQIEVDKFNADTVRADKFIELVKRHTEFTEFSAALLNEFIEKIIVHEAVKINGVRKMKLDIYLNYIGKFELPELEEPQEEAKKQLAQEAVSYAI